MPSLLNTIMDFLSSPSFEIVKFAVLGYFGLLWLAIIIWVTRDSIHRSNSLIFQTFSILINIAIPILGVLLYLIIRPAKTNLERYYEELETRLLAEEKEARRTPDSYGDTGKSISCDKCLSQIDEKYSFCPVCGIKIKQECKKCKKDFLTAYTICPFCGVDNEKEPAKAPIKKAPRKPKIQVTNEL